MMNDYSQYFKKYFKALQETKQILMVFLCSENLDNFQGQSLPTCFKRLLIVQLLYIICYTFCVKQFCEHCAYKLLYYFQRGLMTAEVNKNFPISTTSTSMLGRHFLNLFFFIIQRFIYQYKSFIYHYKEDRNKTQQHICS